MNQFRYKRADVDRLVSKLRIKIEPRYRTMCNPDGPQGRLDRIRRVVTALIKYERVELQYITADESRGYVERLISEAIRHGDKHRDTMDMATYWLKEKQLVHKLFKVLVPRFSQYHTSYTSLYKAPLKPTCMRIPHSLLELKGNPFPPIIFDGSRNKNLIHNVLLEEARKEHRKENYVQMVKKVSQLEKQAGNNGTAIAPDDSDLSKVAVEVDEKEAFLKCDTADDFESDPRPSNTCV